MRRAIAISGFGLGSTSPNPPVGCVILDRDGIPVGEGYHQRKGEPHAEVNALAAAGLLAAGGTAVVTLEPCNHHGRTPPCHQALLDAGITRVLIAVIDPTSRGDGGAARLRAAGIDVELGVLADEALLVLGHWLDALKTARPRVVWAYQHGPDGPQPCDDEAMAEMYVGVDALMDTDAHIVEGAPGAHGMDAFSLPSGLPGAEPARTLGVLYGGGVRSLLLHGGAQLAQPYLRQGVIDEVIVFLPTSAPSAEPLRAQNARGAGFLPPQFNLESVQRNRLGLIVRASRAAI